MIRTVIVDDEILSRIGIQSFIDGKEDVSVSGLYESAEDALIALRENPVDIVITDIEMAQMNGLQFIKIIREENLADGVIILSCHDDFSYAQEAISRGTDSYLLKYSITEEKILEEIHKVYDKVHINRLEKLPRHQPFQNSDHIPEDGIYYIGILHIRSSDNRLGDEDHLDGTMLTHLLDGIVEKYKMGTLIAPYNKEPFIIFRFPPETSKEEISNLMDTNISLLSKNMVQYISRAPVFGFSRLFSDLKMMREKYDEALRAVELAFYDTGKTVFYYQMLSEEIPSVFFSTERFMEKGGAEFFEKELESFLQKARFRHIEVQKMKEQLVQSVMLMIYQIMKDYELSAEFTQKWNSDLMFVSAVMTAGTERCLKEKLLAVIGQFQKEMSGELDRDSMAEAFAYIERNLDRKISVSELADIVCMSIPSFSKKFKDRTGLTAIEYINEQRIRKAKILMKNKNYSLEQIAEMTGFSNANYMIRVLKKVTGQTASDYRKHYNHMKEK